MKKTLIILGIVIVLGGIIWLILKPEGQTPTTNTSGGTPFGSGEDIVNIPTLGGTGSTTSSEEISLDETITEETRMFRISDNPVAGFGMFLRGGETVLRFVDRGTGHIYESIIPKTTESKNLNTRKITNNTLPKIYEAHFRNDGSAVLLRSLEEESEIIRNLSLTLIPPRRTSTSSTETLYTITATSLRGGMDSILAGNNLTYVLKDSATIVSSGFSGEAPRNLFSSNISEWRLGRMGVNLLVFTKASGSADGYAFSLPASGGSLTKILGPFKGLIALANNNGTKVLYSYLEDGTKMAVRENDGTVYQILPSTLADKCVWSTKNNNAFYCGIPITGVAGFEPDNWYLGRSHFTDYIWKFDTLSEASTLVAQPKTDFGLDIDVSDPKISPNEDYLVFINKRDLTLWAIKLN
jgi:hypothetical protein